MTIYADIIIDISVENLDRTFQYKVPDDLSTTISVGDRVAVPFGNGNRQLNGFVLELSNTPKIDAAKIKEITNIITDSSLVEQKLINLAYFMKNHYGSTMNHALKTVIPVKKSVKNLNVKTIVLKLDTQEANERLDVFKKKHQVARARLLEELINERELDYKLVTSKLNVSAATIKALAELEIIEVVSKRIYRNTVPNATLEEKKILNENQQAIVDDFIKRYDEGDMKPALLFGITGSGKTEVYMEMIDHVVAMGKSCIVLIPEIALTYQTVLRFYKRFGDRVSTLHSKLSDGEKYDQFERAKNHEIDIMIGPRSALFTPFDNLGLIVIDEEHEHSYKSEQMPKYHAKDIALELARLHNATVVFGSATPDISSFYEAKAGNYKLYELRERAKAGASLPKASIVDLRDELKKGNKSIFSEELKAEIGKSLFKNEQVMLFLNRRGYAGFVSCRACGEALKCPHCDVSLTAHRNGRLVCHYCGYEQAEVKACPKCNSKLIGGMRAGTEAVETEISKLFPYARVLRMDKDTTKNKGDYENILAAFANREADILVGTQMIVKGHDFSNVTLVGVLAADMSLNGSDYKAAERTYQLIVQAAGRAGRSDKQGKVIIQTYQPEHYAIQNAIKQDYEDFYNEEIVYRNLMGYPPAGHMLAILVEAVSEEVGERFADSLAQVSKNAIMRKGVCIGPAQATIKKISDIYRYTIYVKSKEMDCLIKVKDDLEAYLNDAQSKNIRVSFDFDPVSGY